MEKEPSVTIGISFYNAERYLENAIRSVIAQTYRNWELILVDDGSVDGSLKVAESIKDPRIRLYSDGANKKLAARLNEINSLASSEFIARMDADDLMSVNRIKEQVNFLLKNPNKDLVATGLCTISDSAKPLGVRAPKSRDLNSWDVLSGGHGIVHASVMAKSSWYKRNPYEEALPLAQDYWLWVNAIANDDLNIGFIEKPLYFYREEGSVTAEKMLVGHKIGREVIARMGPRTIGKTKSAMLIAKSFIKTAVVKVASAVGQTEMVVGARSAGLAEAEAAQIVGEIAKIMETRLPA